MKAFPYAVPLLKEELINLGKVGENGRTQIVFHSKEVFDEYPNAIPSLTVVNPAGTAYPAVVTREGDDVVWTVTSADLTNHGDGKLQLTFSDNGVVVKSYIAMTWTDKSIVPTGPVPDPVGNFIEQAGTVLGEVQQALTDIPTTIETALTEAKASGEFNGADGAPGRDGQDGAPGRDGQDGAPGRDGQDGAPGQDGKDGADGTDGKDGKDGKDGQDGQSAYVYIRYAANQPTADSDMKTTPDAWIGFHSGSEASAPTHYTEYDWYKIKGETGASGNVQDVQIDGTTILNQGVANIPKASTSNAGVIILGTGLYLDGNNTGKVVVDYGSSNQIKAGTSNIGVPISRQHVSAFYALAKLAGVDLANQTVTLGEYPAAALAAIQKMLGIYEAPWEIINEETFTNAEEADKIITTDKYGQSFELTEVMMLFELPKLATGDVDSSKGQYGQIWFNYDNGTKSIQPEPGAFSRTVGGDAKCAWFYIQNNKGLIVSMATSAISNTNSASIRMRYCQGNYDQMGVFIDDGSFAITSVNIKKVTGNGRYRLYGRRKWRT